MVLALLGTSITGAIQLDVITSALFQVDFNFKQIMELEKKIKKIVNLDQLAAGHDERKIIKQAFFNELCKILDPGKPSFTPKTKYRKDSNQNNSKTDQVVGEKKGHE